MCQRCEMVEKADSWNTMPMAAAEQRQFPRLTGSRLFEYFDETERWASRQEQKAEQGRLAGARGAREKTQGPGPQVEADILQNFGPIAVTQAHTV